jgi:hypothetical protein
MAHKLYLVNFKYNKKKYFKAGITGKGDVMERFKDAIQEYRLEDFKIMKSSWFKTEQEADKAEKSLFETIKTLYPENNYVDKNGKHYFHNEWFDEKLNGITEIRKYNHKEVQVAFQFIAENGARYYKDLL